MKKKGNKKRHREFYFFMYTILYNLKFRRNWSFFHKGRKFISLTQYSNTIFSFKIISPNVRFLHRTLTAERNGSERKADQGCKQN